ncbi:MAG TPA: efflux RND transporter periplasmic adaptor subunit [Anaerolineaceae bacterium]|nr:efflux RND transporter periplasmic adaptor subunit [Anaerolineaceae bacterium]
MTQSDTKKRSRAWLTWLIILIIFALVAFFVVRSRQSAAAKAFAALETANVNRQTMVTSISGTGTVRPEALETMLWTTSGHVADEAVKLGQNVKKGQILLTLAENDLPVDILQARIDAASIQESLDNLPADTTLQRAQLQARISTSQQSLEALQKQLTDLQTRICTSWHLADLQSRFDDAESTYKEEPTQQNKSRLDLARTNLDFCDESVIKQKISDLQSQVESQQTSIQKDQQDLEKIKDGPDPVTKEKLENQLAIAQKRMQAAEIKAPFDGVVTAIYSQPGTATSPNTKAVQVADLSIYYIDVPVAEVDIPVIELGQEADLVFDAFFTDTYHGKVTQIDKVGQEIAGVVNYNVTITMTDGIEKINPGMTAGVTIITAAKPNVLVVPSAAVKTVEGDSVVYVLKNSTPQAVKVRVGAYSSDSVEILEGDLQEGETLVLNPPSNIMQLFTQSRRMR